MSEIHLLSEFLYWLQTVVALDQAATEENDEELKALGYGLRNRAIVRAFGYAIEVGIPCGIRVDPEEPEWPVIFFQFPTGQASFHVPQFTEPWDLHTKEQAIERITAYLKEWEGKL